MRQIGLAMHQYCDAHKGRFPIMQHNIDPDQMPQTWIYVLAPYMESVDAIRLCPEDLKRIENPAYTNAKGDVVEVQAHELCHEWLPASAGHGSGRPEPGFAPKFSQLAETHNTIVMFEAGTAVDVTKDHVECPDWFGFDNMKYNTPPYHAVWDQVSGEVAVIAPSWHVCELLVRRRARGHDHGRPDRGVVRCGNELRDPAAMMFIQPGDVIPAYIVAGLLETGTAFELISTNLQLWSSNQ